VASIGHLLVSKIIDEQSLAETIKAGIKPDYFGGEWGDVYQWILTYNNEHGHVPSHRAFSNMFGDVEILDASHDSYSALHAELLDIYREKTVANAMTEAVQKMDKSEDIQEAINILQGGLRAASVDTVRIRDFNIVETWEDRLANYEEMRAHPENLLGIDTGFVGLNRITRGFRGQQFICLVGEPKRGKSLFELIMASACHRTGRTPMFVSFEMSVDEQMARYDALNAKIPYEAILSGNMTQKEMDRLERVLKLGKEMHPFIMSEDSTSLTTLTSLANKVQEYQPDALYVDGLYLMDDEEGEKRGSPQALTNITRGIKRMAQRFDIPIIGTTQVLPSKINNQRTRAITADSIGYSSSFIQDSDLILGVERHPDFQDRAIIRVVEGRSVARAEVHIHWDWQTMEFEEVDEREDDDRGGSYD
jgi:replicative DNA helicase